MRRDHDENKSHAQTTLPLQTHPNSFHCPPPPPTLPPFSPSLPTLSSLLFIPSFPPTHAKDDFGIGVFVLALSFGIIARSASAGARLVDKSTFTGRYGASLLAVFTRFPYTV